MSREGRRSAELRRRSNMLTALDRDDKFVYGSSTYLSEVRRSSALSASYLSPVVGSLGVSSGVGSLPVSSSVLGAGSLTGGRVGFAGTLGQSQTAASREGERADGRMGMS